MPLEVEQFGMRENFLTSVDRRIPIILPHGELCANVLGRGFGHTSVLGGRSSLRRFPCQIFGGGIEVDADAFENILARGRLEFPLQVVDPCRYGVQIEPFEPFVEFEIGPAAEKLRLGPLPVSTTGSSRSIPSAAKMISLALPMML